MSLTQTKICKTCNTELLLDKFSKGQGKYKKANVCKRCDAERRRLDYATLPTHKKSQIKKRQRVYEYKRVYGLPNDIAEKLANSREGICKICNQTNLLVVDHCHISGEVRGLICSHCNSVLGYAKDNIEVLENAIEYLKGAK